MRIINISIIGLTPSWTFDAKRTTRHGVKLFHALPSLYLFFGLAIAFVTGCSDSANSSDPIVDSNSSGPIGAGGQAAYNVVLVVESSRNAGAGGAPEHCDPKPDLTPVAASSTSRTLITVKPPVVRQTIVGFGSAMTEVAASTILVLPKSQQAEIFNKLFAPTENNYTVARTTIGSSDFSLSEYNYDDNAGDTKLDKFSVAQDQKYVIPALKAALAVNSNLKILSSPWSAPKWMKNGGSGTSGITPAIGMQGGTLNPTYYPTWADYFVKYIQEYAKVGLPIWAITVQNESAFSNEGVRENMAYTEATQNIFVRDHLGPALQKANFHPTPQVYIWDHNNEPATWGNASAYSFAREIYKDHRTSPFVAGTAVHWYASTFQCNEAELEKIHALDAAKTILFTEGTADGPAFGNPQKANFSKAPWWENDDYFWTRSTYDWTMWDGVGDPAGHPIYHTVNRYARDIISGLNHWYTGWIEWNAVLNKYGAQAATASPPGVGNAGDPGVSHIPNACVTGIMVDESNPAAATIYYTPLYYVMRHFSKYIFPGAKILGTTVNLAAGVTLTDYDGSPLPDGVAMYATAALNPDGTTAVVIFNQTGKAIDYTVQLGTQAVNGTAPAQSLQTLTWTTNISSLLGGKANVH